MYGGLPLDGSLPYPTVTVCPVQFYDRWNLQRALVNQIRLLDHEGTPERRTFATFRVSQ